MKKRLSAVLAALLMALLLLPATVRTAWANDYDEIVNYDVTVQPNVDDGSLSFTVSFDWKALEELPYGERLEIGIPNGSIRDVKTLTDNIEKLEFDNSFMYVYLTQKYKSGETFRFAYSWVQEYMYTLGDDGAVTYEYTPVWFDKARVDHMSVTWLTPAGVSGDVSWYADDSSRWTVGNGVLYGTDLPHGSQVHLTAAYPNWPAQLSWEGSSENLPGGDWGGGSHSSGDNGGEIFALMILVFVIVMVLVIIVAASRDGYAGGFGTHYVYVNHLWYPAGPNGQPKPGSVGTPHKPKPPATHHSGGLGGGGFGGGSHGGGGFGSSGFGGGSHCACASSCACACACACAGGGRAGCSAKNLYGAIHLDETVSRRLEEKE